MRKQVHDSEAHLVVSAKNSIQDYLHGDEFAGGAPQKGSSIPRRIQWARSSIQAILKSAKEYAYGIKIQSRKGELFEIPVDPIINTATFERFVELRAWKKTFPASRLHRDYLLGGILHCACGNKWGARTQKTRKNRKGVLVERKTLTGIYYCRQNHKDLVSPDCPRHIGSKRLIMKLGKRYVVLSIDLNTFFHKPGI